METFAKRLAAARKNCNKTQAEVADHLGVSFQAVSLWERGESTPEIDRLSELADLYGVTTDWLLSGKQILPMPIDFFEPLSDRLFNEEHMYTYIKTYATIKNLYQTIKVLPYARELHKDQVRKGKDQVPYIYHPLLISCHALALGLDDDNLVSAALLHDICEDCNIAVHELPVNEETKAIVSLLTKRDFHKNNIEAYYAEIQQNPQATLIKLLDRCNNISGMAAGFSKHKLVEYINETEKWIYPLMQQAKTNYPQFSNQIFIIKYHTVSVIAALKHQLAQYQEELI